MSKSKLIIGIKSIPATKNSPASYEISIGDIVRHTMEKPKFCESLKQELNTLLFNFYKYAQSKDVPKAFDIEAVQDGWIARPVA